jgi:hypothetical protein
VIVGCRTTCTRRRSRSARARQGGALHEAARRNAEEAKRILDTVERAGIFAGYLEDLVYTPKTLKAVAPCRRADRRRHVGALARDASRPAQRVVLGRGAGGGGAIVDLGCHCSRSSAASWARATGP